MPVQTLFVEIIQFFHLYETDSTNVFLEKSTRITIMFPFLNSIFKDRETRYFFGSIKKYIPYYWTYIRYAFGFMKCSSSKKSRKLRIMLEIAIFDINISY